MTTDFVVMGSFAEDPNAPEMCERCGGLYPSDQPECPYCAAEDAAEDEGEVGWIRQQVRVIGYSNENGVDMVIVEPYNAAEFEAKMLAQGEWFTKHGDPSRPNYRLLHPPKPERRLAGYVLKLLSDNPKKPDEEDFVYQSRVCSLLPDGIRHRALSLIRERYDPATPALREAKEWRQAHGLPEPKVDWDSVQADLDKAKAVAAAYEKLTNRPDDPRVKAAYEDFKRQNEEMWAVIVAPESEGGMGLTVEFVDDKEPYASAKEQRDDVANNRRIKVSNDLGAGHPLMTTSEYNRFRAVHDVFGHVAIGTGFDRHGEYAAWLHHNSMYTGEGRRAMSTEYHGSNSATWNGGNPRAVADLLPDDLTENTFDEAGNWARKGLSEDELDAELAVLIDALKLEATFANRFDNAYAQTGSNHIAAMSVEVNGAEVKLASQAEWFEKHGSPDRPGYSVLHPRTRLGGGRIANRLPGGRTERAQRALEDYEQAKENGEYWATSMGLSDAMGRWVGTWVGATNMQRGAVELLGQSTQATGRGLNGRRVREVLSAGDIVLAHKMLMSLRYSEQREWEWVPGGARQPTKDVLWRGMPDIEGKIRKALKVGRVFDQPLAAFSPSPVIAESHANRGDDFSTNASPAERVLLKVQGARGIAMDYSDTPYEVVTGGRFKVVSIDKPNPPQITTYTRPDGSVATVRWPEPGADRPTVITLEWLGAFDPNTGELVK